MKKNPNKKTSLGDLLLAFRRNIVDDMKKGGFSHELTFSQVEVFHFIESNGQKTMKEIADFLKITPPSATEIVAEMEKKGLLKRTGSKDDRRVVFITMTDTAKKLSTSVCKRKEVILNKMVSRLSEKDHRNLERIIRTLISK